jgi:hypothetical protein
MPKLRIARALRKQRTLNNVLRILMASSSIEGLIVMTKTLSIKRHTHYLEQLFPKRKKIPKTST